MQEIQVQSLGGKIPWSRPWDHKELDMTEVTEHAHMQ